MKLTNEDTAQVARTAERTKNFIESVLGDGAGGLLKYADVLGRTVFD